MRAEKKSSPLVTIVTVAVVAAVASLHHWFASVDTAYYDFVLGQNLLDYPEDVVVIAVDEPSIERLGAWPWDRRYHARLLAKLKLADAVVLDFIFAEPQSLVLTGDPSLDSTTSPDQLFAQAMIKQQNVLLPVYVQQAQTGGELREVLPLPLFSEAAAVLAHAHVDYGENGIARGVYLREGLGSPYWPHLSIALAQMLGETPANHSGERAVHDGETSHYEIYRDYFNLLRFVGPPNTIYRNSYIDVLDGLIAPEQWRGKRVFVGATATGLGDEIPTPLGALPGVEFHANAYQAARTNGYIQRPSTPAHMVLTVVLVMLITTLLSRLTPVQFLLMTFVSLALLTTLTYLLLVLAHYWFSSIAALIAVALFYPLWSWRRIEIALSFLQQELALLQKGSMVSDFNIDTLKCSLQGLVDIGVIKTWSLQSLATPASKENAKLTAATHNVLQWPKVTGRLGEVETGFSVEKVYYYLGIQSVDHDYDLVPVLTALLSTATSVDDSPLSSYELVEETIGEIYSIKDVAEKAQLRMNKSMAELQDAVLVADAAGKIIFTNDNFRAVFSQSFIDQPLVALQKKISGYVWLGILRTLMIEQERVYQELSLIDERSLLCQGALINDQDNSQDILVFVFTDVTQLRYLERGKNEALAFLSHDMRSPIVSLLSLIETYRINHAAIKSDEQVFIEQLEFFARKNLKYSEDFLQLSRAENIDREVFQLVDMHGVIDGAYAQVFGLSKNKNVDVIIERTPDDCWISGDVQLLERAVTNILSNAIQYTPPGKQVTLSLHLSQGVQIVIKDQGSGIPEAMIPHLFEPYFRARDKSRGVADASLEAPKANSSDGVTVSPAISATSPATTNQGAKSYGLGLSFVHTVVKRHGGSIYVNSEIDIGSSFTLKFPAVAVE